MICNSEGCSREVVQYYIKRESKYQTKKRCKTCEHLLRRYNLTDPQRLSMIKEQDSKCLCCGDTFDLSGGQGQKNKPHVDHCHVTGRVRAVLCGRCNQMLGHVNEDIEILEGMIAYIKEYC